MDTRQGLRQPFAFARQEPRRLGAAWQLLSFVTFFSPPIFLNLCRKTKREKDEQHK
jgi:hypothetical protein